MNEEKPDMPDEVVRTRSGGTAWYEAELEPSALLEKRFAELNELNRARNDDLANESLDARYGVKLAELEALLDHLELDEEIRDGAAEQLQHARDDGSPIEDRAHT